MFRFLDSLGITFRFQKELVRGENRRGRGPIPNFCWDGGTHLRRIGCFGQDRTSPLVIRMEVERVKGGNVAQLDTLLSSHHWVESRNQINQSKLFHWVLFEDLGSCLARIHLTFKFQCFLPQLGLSRILEEFGNFLSRRSPH